MHNKNIFQYLNRVALDVFWCDQFVEAFKQTTVEEWHLAEQGQRGVGIFELAFVAVRGVNEVFIHALRAGGLSPDALHVSFFVLVRHFGVEGGKKQVLQNRAAVVAIAAVQMRRGF